MLTGTPATIDSRVSCAPPLAASQRKTSVDVPPISKPMMRSKPAQRATWQAPMTPPAGPDKHRAHRFRGRAPRRDDAA